MSSSNSITNTTSSSTIGGTSSLSTTPKTSFFIHNIASTTSTYKPTTDVAHKTFANSPGCIYPGRQPKFTEHFEYSEWKDMSSVVDHSKHF
ncbi:hypothetical protein SMACR_00104 [Sordaria macrospora]|uniref:WGS project CABT00000000 data, contig 2.1 n=2 Tax=Sordaria macrospora TaxID=5147 RepID=F7VK62_SORMK|nr:uncharacterized protein SMAC_00104 [Sordaria macrospora k-hell]KAA8632359.1 hypothetical protein SMACR_00104 [Sordaria macrospora]KAH7632219.1 hypothetical protein B0T09DRAFT_408116 [Sordaria sp. MPI-SDFR-AT-0083]WPJ63491.1 hypothetical protein SMAC4_00104 [Sordaria macrospora]CCC05889.1 unnamed protein product [Sordaria macrospora k-hell]